MTRIEAALKLAARGFYVFPLNTSGRPIFEGWPDLATRDEATIRKWWTDPVLGTEEPNWIGIYAGKFDLPDGRTVSLLCLDIDVKNGRNGRPAFTDLELTVDLPATYSQTTKSGGRHVVYWVLKPCRNLVDVWPGIDTRGKGGFFVAAGSPGYEGNDLPVVPAPEALLASPALSRVAQPVAAGGPVLGPTSPEAAFARAVAWLVHAKPAVEGEAGDFRTYHVVCKLRDMGVPPHLVTHALVSSGWNDRCDPPWDLKELDQKVQNAFRYAQNEASVDDPARDFTPEQIENPERLTVESLNAEFGYVMLGGSSSILWETKDDAGRPVTQFISPAAFHDMMAPRRPSKFSRKWMSHPKRRTYHGVVFSPGKAIDPRWYNLWSGFAVQAAPRHETAPPEVSWALKAWEEHLVQNICRGNEAHALWVKGWLATMIQRPQDRPRIAMVLRGLKGVGKSLWIETVGYLLGRHFASFSDSRYILGNFNAHLESCLLVVLEEAFWGGDKQAEGILKDLITRTKHPIERKYCETYHVESFLRVVIIGNEDWVVPASLDERRFAIFEVGNSRRNDHQFFGRMKAGMENGGYNYLLRELARFDTSQCKLHSPPATEGLRRQKEESLDPFRQWWMDCLIEGHFVGLAEGVWPSEASLQTLKLAYSHYCATRNMRSRIPSDAVLARTLQQIVPKAHRKQVGGRNLWVLPSLGECRTLWDNAVGGKRDWNQ